MTWYEAQQLTDLIQMAVSAVAGGILAGACWSALFRIKTPKGD